MVMFAPSGSAAVTARSGISAAAERNVASALNMEPATPSIAHPAWRPSACGTRELLVGWGRRKHHAWGNPMNPRRGSEACKVCARSSQSATNGRSTAPQCFRAGRRASLMPPGDASSTRGSFRNSESDGHIATFCPRTQRTRRGKRIGRGSAHFSAGEGHNTDGAVAVREEEDGPAGAGLPGECQRAARAPRGRVRRRRGRRRRFGTLPPRWARRRRSTAQGLPGPSPQGSATPGADGQARVVLA